MELSTAEEQHSDDQSRERQQQMLSIDEIIEKFIGGFGRAQLFHVIVVALGWAFDAQHTFVTIFTDVQPSWRCTDAAPFHMMPGRAWQITETRNCTAESSICKMDPNQWEWTRGKEASVVSEWNLVCANSTKAGLPALVFFSGTFLGCLILGPLADSWLGRKRTLMLSSLMLSVTGFLTALSPNIWIYSLLRAISGFGRSSMGTYCLVLSTELVGRKWRGTIGLLVFFSFTLGFLSIPGLAYLTRLHFSWRTTYVYISILPMAYSLFLLPLVCESPRWLVLQGKPKEALESLRKMAELNGRSVPENVGIEECGTENYSISVLSRLWATKWACKRMILTMGVGFGMGLTYYGMPFGVGNLDFNLYLSVAFNALSEIPAAILSTVLVAKQGRRRAILLLTLISGMFCFVCVFSSMNGTNIPHSGTKGKVSTGRNWWEMVGELGAFVSAVTAFNVLLIYCLELFPTSVRNSSMSMLRQAISVGALVSPVIVIVGRRAPSFSFGLFGIVIIISGLFVLGLPETKDRPLYETLEDQECRESEYKSGAMQALLS